MFLTDVADSGERVQPDHRHQHRRPCHLPSRLVHCVCGERDKWSLQSKATHPYPHRAHCGNDLSSDSMTAPSLCGEQCFMRLALCSRLPWAAAGGDLNGAASQPTAILCCQKDVLGYSPWDLWAWNHPTKWFSHLNTSWMHRAGALSCHWWWCWGVGGRGEEMFLCGFSIHLLECS